MGVCFENRNTNEKRRNEKESPQLKSKESFILDKSNNSIEIPQINELKTPNNKVRKGKNIIKSSFQKDMELNNNAGAAKPIMESSL